MHPTILVVDDHQLYRTTFCMLLQLCWPAARIVEAADERQALAVLPQHAWDCLILDDQLPTLRGGELARHLRARAHAYGQTLPTLVLMSSQPNAAALAQAIGAVATLPKPIERLELRNVLTPVLGTLLVNRRALPRHRQRGVTQPLPAALAALRTRPSAGAEAAVRRVHTRAHISQLQSHIDDLVHQTISRFPPPYAAAEQRPLLPTERVGDYLVQRGYLTRWQLTCALQANQSPAQRGRVPLGFIVRAHNLVPSPVLSVLLLQQFGDRLAARPAAPRFIGEQLLLSAELAPAQLAMALQEQLDDYQDGRWVRLGDILARHGWRSAEASSAVAADLARRD